MGIRINTNISSLNTQRHLSNSTMSLSKSMEKLSSGLRINRAGDDAAGLAISEGLKSDIRALDQAARNAADGISLVQTGEGAMDEVSSILLRMKELAEQSLNGTLSDTDRGYLNAEYSALTSEIDRISAATEFNGVKLLDGSGSATLGIQVGIGTAASDSVAILATRSRSRPRRNPKNHMAPWRFVDEDGRCDLTFTPFFRRRSSIDLLLLKSKVNQMFGRYNGTLTCDDGSSVEVDNVIGWAEDHDARW